MAKIMIEVPDGLYCWKYSAAHSVCRYFENSLGYPRCQLYFDNTKEDKTGPLKSPSCIEKEVK